MKAESVAYAVAGMCFGVILGWVLATQDAGRAQEFTQPPQAQTAAPAPANQPPPALDAERVRTLQSAIEKSPRDAASLAQLGDLYFDAEHWTEAIDAYRRSLAIEPDNADVSTDLGVSYYSTNRVDEALEQFEHSLRVSPNHTKTLFNKGIVLAFGKEDLRAASDVWKQVVDVAPDSPEGQRARELLEGLAAAAHQGQDNTNQ